MNRQTLIRITSLFLAGILLWETPASAYAEELVNEPVKQIIVQEEPLEEDTESVEETEVPSNDEDVISEEPAPAFPFLPDLSEPVLR